MQGEACKGKLYARKTLHYVRAKSNSALCKSDSVLCKSDSALCKSARESSLHTVIYNFGRLENISLRLRAMIVSTESDSSKSLSAKSL